MITLNKPSILTVAEETQSERAVEKLSINYNYYLGDVNGVPQGMVAASIFSEYGQIEELNLSFEDTEFKGKDVLGILHTKYIPILKTLNSKITFTDTYN